MLLLAVMVAGSIYLIVLRRDRLRSEARLDSLLSREAVFLFQNLVLVAMVFVIFWVTFFPLISEALTGTKVSVGPPAFRPFIVPLALVLVLLSGIGPIIAWRRVTVANLRRNFVFPVAAGLVALVVLILFGGGTDSRPFALIMFALGTFVIASVVQELWRGVAARRAITRDSVPVAFVQLIRRNRRRYGGYIVHAGLAVLLIGVAASSSFQHSRDVILKPGQSSSVDGYKIAYVRPTATATAAKLSFGAVLNVTKGGNHVVTLHTTRGFYPSQDPDPGDPRAVLQRLGGQLGGTAGRADQGHLDCDQPRPDSAAGRDQPGRPAVSEAAQPGDGGHCRQAPHTGPGADRAGPAVAGTRPGDRRSHQPVRDPPVAGRVPADRRSDGHLDLARRHHHRHRWPDRPVAGPGTRPPPRDHVAFPPGRAPSVPARELV